MFSRSGSSVELRDDQVQPVEQHQTGDLDPGVAGDLRDQGGGEFDTGLVDPAAASEKSFRAEEERSGRSAAPSTEGSMDTLNTHRGDTDTDNKAIANADL